MAPAFPGGDGGGTYTAGTLIMQLLRDNLTQWTKDADELVPEEPVTKLG